MTDIQDWFNNLGGCNCRNQWISPFANKPYRKTGRVMKESKWTSAIKTESAPGSKTMFKKLMADLKKLDIFSLDELLESTGIDKSVEGEI